MSILRVRWLLQRRGGLIGSFECSGNCVYQMSVCLGLGYIINKGLRELHRWIGLYDEK